MLSPSAETPLRDSRLSFGIFPDKPGSNARETVRAAVDARVLELQKREERRLEGDETSLFRDGEVFVPASPAFEETMN